MDCYPKAAMERAMKVQDVILQAMAKKITWWQAAEVLGISDRHMRRWRERYVEEGYNGLFDRRRGKPSRRRVPVATVERVFALYWEKYFDLNVQHFHEKLQAAARVGSADDSGLLAASAGTQRAQLWNLARTLAAGAVAGRHRERGNGQSGFCASATLPSSTEVAVLSLAPSGEEVDHADSSLARGAEPLYDFVAGAHARAGKGGIMNLRLLNRWAREEALPLPSRTHPLTPKTTSAIYTEELTDLRLLSSRGRTTSHVCHLSFHRASVRHSPI
jgi:hypothetical protein